MWGEGAKLTKNDRCFFALAFYRQAVTEAFFTMQRDPDKAMELVGQACYWWEQYIERRIVR